MNQNPETGGALLLTAGERLAARREWWHAAVDTLAERERARVLERAYLRHFVGDHGYDAAVARAARAHSPTESGRHQETILICYIAEIEAGLLPGVTPVAFDVPTP